MFRFKIKPRQQQNIVFIVLIMLVGSLIYAATLNHSFHFDDLTFFFDAGRAGKLKINDFDFILAKGVRRFVGLYSFALNYHFHQDRVLGYHLVNIVIHLLTATLVFSLTKLIFSTPVMKKHHLARHKEKLAFFAGLIFVAHPIQTQAVTYIVQRLTSMATLFYVLTLVLYCRWRIMTFKRKTNRKKSIILLILIAASFLLGAFTKEIVYSLPVIILLFEFFFFKTKQKKIGRLSKNKWRLILLVCGVVIASLYPFRQSLRNDFIVTKVFTGEKIDSMTYLITQPRVLVKYLQLLFVPLNQSVDYLFTLSRSFFETQVLLSLSLLLLVGLIGVRLFKHNRVLTFGIAWFFVTLAIESSVIPLAEVIAEHRLYLPMVGFSIWLVVVLAEVFLRRRGWIFLGVVLSSLVVSYSVLTIQRNKVWQDEVTLWTDVLNQFPDGHARAHYNLGLGLLRQGVVDQAYAHFIVTTTIKSDHAKSYNNLGVIYLGLREYDKAIAHFRKAISLDSNLTVAWMNLGDAFMAKDQALLESENNPSPSPSGGQ